MSKETNYWKDLILESLDFIRYKIESDRLTVGEAESIARAFISQMDIRGTANDFAAFYNKPKTNVTSLIDRKVMHKPVREVLYPFFPIRDAVPDSWHAPQLYKNHTKYTDKQ